MNPVEDYGGQDSMKNLIKKVKIDSNVYEVIINHALLNEREENMGLLIGNVEETDCVEEEKMVVNVHSLILLQRSDKRQDRVEISPEQLSNASEFAENLSKQTNSALRIIGWYHSHPNITIWPSHVDIKTQSIYQMMDRNFIGLIVSVFNNNRQNNLNTVELICFQSNEKLEAMFVQIPVEICESHSQIATNQTMIQTIFNVYQQLPSILIEEESSVGTLSKDLDKFQLAAGANMLSLMSDIGVFLHSSSRVIEITYLQTIKSLKCREIGNTIQINLYNLFMKRLQNKTD